MCFVFIFLVIRQTAPLFFRLLSSPLPPPLPPPPLFFTLLCSSLVFSDFEKYRISAPLSGVTSDYFSEEGGHDRGETLSLSPLSLPLSSSSSSLSSLSRVYKERSLVSRFTLFYRLFLLLRSFPHLNTRIRIYHCLFLRPLPV